MNKKKNDPEGKTGRPPVLRNERTSLYVPKAIKYMVRKHEYGGKN